MLSHLHCDELRQSLECILGEVGPRALTVLVRVVIREGDDQEVRPQLSGSGQALLYRVFSILC